MKNFLFRQQGYLTTNNDTIATNNRTLADFPELCGFFPKNNRLHSFVLFRMLAVQSEKEIAEPGNSNNLQLANKSTPSNRAIFVCSARTPKENNRLKIEFVVFLQNKLGMSKTRHTRFISMVACNGKGFALCYVPIVVVFQPVTRYRPNPGKFSGSLHQSQLELSAMIYLFQCVNRYASAYQEQIVLIHADNAENARFKLTAQFALLSTVAQFPDRLAQQAVQKYARLQQRLAGAFTLSAEKGACYA